MIKLRQTIMTLLAINEQMEQEDIFSEQELSAGFEVMSSENKFYLESDKIWKI